MGAQLLFRDVKGKDASVDLPRDGAFLGRGTDCIVRTDDATVSRKNCKIAFAGDGWLLEDLDSPNGTFVNDVKIKKQVLTHADVIRCGTLQVRFIEVADLSQPSVRAKQQDSVKTPIPKEKSKKEKQKAKEEKSAEKSRPKSVEVDSSLENSIGGSLSSLKGKDLIERAEKLQKENEMLSAVKEANQAELNKLRNEVGDQRQKLNEITREKSQLDEELNAQVRVTEELRREVLSLKTGHSSSRDRVDVLETDLAARQKQLERAEEEIQRNKGIVEELRGQVIEAQKFKDEGWKELNSRVAEIESLRQVIAEQERLLEERRVGLVTLEVSVKELRAEKQNSEDERVRLKAEHETAREQAVRARSQLEALEEDQRRLVRRMTELTNGGATTEQANELSQEQIRMFQEHRELKVEVKKLESERSRFEEEVRRLNEERILLSDKHAQGDVDRAVHIEQRQQADLARQKAEEALLKTESARHLAEEKLAVAERDREQALLQVAKLRDELAARTTSSDSEEVDAPESTVRTSISDIESKAALELAEKRVHELEEKVAHMTAELALSPVIAAPVQAIDQSELRTRAEEAYAAVNDVLSELRTSVRLIKELVEQSIDAIPAETAMTLQEAVQASVNQTEEAKNILQPLRDLLEPAT